MATFHTFTTVGVTHNGIPVPQRVYDAGGGGVWGAPVAFPGKLYLKDAINEVYRGNPAYEDQPTPFAAVRARFTLRIEWPGYPSWEANLNARERNEQALPVCRWLLAKKIAEVLQRWVQQAGRGADPDWDVGKAIPFDKLVLHELRQVTPGSWQPVIIYDV